MTFSYLSHLECPSCSALLDPDRLQGTCYCGSPLLARYELERLAPSAGRAAFATREPTLWRYHELLPVRQASNVASLGEGMTPLLPLRSLGPAMEVPNLLMKDEGIMPTGTFKARGAAVGVSAACERGARKIAMPTQGNAGAAWSAYAARAGLESLIVMPADAPTVTRAECVVTGAHLRIVTGSIGEAAALVRAAVAADGWFDVSTLKEPYRIEGKKTMGFELVEQLGWRMPDVVVYPTGGGVGLIGIYKAFDELVELGWCSGPLPRLVAAQAEGCAPVVDAFRSGKRSTDAWESPDTIAFGIAIPKPLGDFLILDAIYATGGCAVAVSDAELLAEQSSCARLEGAFVCPEGAAALAAVRKLREKGWLSESDEVVALNTGSGLKYPETVRSEGRLVTSDGARL